MKGTPPSRVVRAVEVYGIEVPRWEVRSLINSLVVWKGKSMTAIVTIGIDLAKNVFAVHGVDATGKPAMVRSTVPRVRFFHRCARSPCRVACHSGQRRTVQRASSLTRQARDRAASVSRNMSDRASQTWRRSAVPECMECARLRRAVHNLTGMPRSAMRCLACPTVYSP